MWPLVVSTVGVAVVHALAGALIALTGLLVMALGI